MRTDLGEVPSGKLMGSAGHAFQMCFWEASLVRSEMCNLYAQSPEHGKIVLGASMKDIDDVAHDARKLGLPWHVVTDLGLTVFSVPTVTCLGLGPLNEVEYESLNLKRFKIYKK